jgi:2-methylcitrate dehydratase PrpD
MERNRNVAISGRSNGAVLTRRNLLQNVGWFIAAAALPTASLAQENIGRIATQPVSPVMAELSEYMSEARSRELTGEVMEKAKQHILDTFAAMISGSRLPGGRAALQFARAYGGEKVATVVGSNILCSPVEAAIANAEFAHSDETDDYFHVGGAHPGCSIVPAALAVGEQFGITGMHFLRAVVLGYDIGMRVTETLDAAASLHDSHGIVGSFGCAAAGGSAAGLSAQQMRWVLDYAAQQAGSGITAWERDTEHIEKGFVFAVMGARNGVTAALLVYSGWNGVDDVLSGSGNFLNAYAPQADPASLVEQLGERYEVTRTNIKKWSVGGPIQLPLDALEMLLKQHHVETAQVRQVIVRLSPSDANTVNNRDMPDICIQYMIAVMLIDKTASFGAAHDKPRMQDPTILLQRAKVQLVDDEELKFPAAKLGVAPKRAAIVEVILNDGTHLSQRAERARGTIDNPMTRDEVIDKSTELIAPVLGKETCTKLIERVFVLESVRDVRELRPLLQRT